MKFRPLNDNVLIKRIKEDYAYKGGLHIPDIAKQPSQEGFVVAIGNGKALSNGKRSNILVNIGDKVLLPKFAGSELNIEGEEYVVIPEGQIYAIILDNNYFR